MRPTYRLAVLSLFLPALLLASGKDAAARPILVELFTSQGCSSCPPADALLTELARDRRDVLPLSFHVTYWNGLGWRDPFSLQAATDRQRHYAALLGNGSVYTPEMIVDGVQDMIGSDRAAAARALDRGVTAAAQLRGSRRGDRVTITAASGIGRGTVMLVGFDAEHRTPVGRGENGGRTLLESNIVRAVLSIGEWKGASIVLEIPVPAGQHHAAILQAEDGRILDAALVEESGS